MPYRRTGGGQPVDQDLADVAAISGSNDDLIQKKAGAWTNRTPSQVKTDLALAKGDVGLGNVDNTADAAKPVSTATQTALNAKQTLDSDLTTIAGLTATTDSFIQAKSSAWAARTVAEVKTDLGITNDTFRRQDFFAAVGASFNPIVAAVSSNSPSSQNVAGPAVYLYSGETVTNVVCCVAVAGSGTAPSGLKLGLWSSAATPVCLAVTAELKDDARWTSTGWKVNALSSPYPVPSSGIYYLAFWMNGTFASTNIQLVLGSTSTTSGFSTPIGSNPRMATLLKSGAASMAAADTGTYAVSSTMPLMGWS